MAEFRKSGDHLQRLILLIKNLIIKRKDSDVDNDKSS